MESQPQNPEFRNNPENFHPWAKINLDSPFEQTLWGAHPQSYIPRSRTISTLVLESFLVKVAFSKLWYMHTIYSMLIFKQNVDFKV